MTYEIRAGLPVELRMDDESTIRVAGHAAVFNERANIAGVFEERIAPGAFAEAIGRDDVVFLINHAGLPLARTRSGTLSLREDERGLYMETELDRDDPEVRSIAPKMKRGDLDKMSFAFMVEREEWDDTGEIPLRTIHQLSLRDVSIVTYPAYDGTDIALRSMDLFRQQALDTLAIHRKINADRRRQAMARQLQARTQES